MIEGVSDGVRRFAEECDTLEGVQCFTEDLGLWGGLTASLADAIADDYPKQPMLLFSTRPPPRPPAPDAEVAALHATHDALNAALATGHLSQACSLYVPLLAAPRPAARQYDSSSRFHASAVQVRPLPRSLSGSCRPDRMFVATKTCPTGVQI